MKKLILLLFLVIYGCGERKTEDISKKNIQKDSIQKDTIKESITQKDTPQENFTEKKTVDTTYQALSFDSLLTKFLYKNSKYFDAIGFNPEKYPFFCSNKDKSYRLTYKDFRTLQLQSLYKKLGREYTFDDYPDNKYYPSGPVAISVNYLANDLIGITVLQREEVGFHSYFLTYKNKKLISYAEEPFMKFGGDMGVNFICETQKNNDSTFYTVDKTMFYGNKLLGHSEVLTTIDKNGIIKQNRRIIVADKSPSDVMNK